MQISTRIRINAYVPLSLLIFVAATLAWSFVKTDQMKRNELLAEEIRQIVFERTLLRDDYFLNGQERAKNQWLESTKELGALLESARERFSYPEIQPALQEAQKTFRDTQLIFSEIVARQIQEGREKGQTIIFREGNPLLINQIFLKAYSLNDQVTKLHSFVQEETRKAQQRTSLIIVIFIIVSIGSVIINSIAMAGVFTKRLALLKKGVAQFGQGHLDERIDVAGNDEFSDLARLSNEMAEKLSHSHTSLENLQREVAIRKQAEEETRRKDSQYQQLIEHAEDGIFTISAAGQFLFVNDKLCRMLGYTREEFLRRNILDTYPDNARTTGTQRLAKLQQGEALRFERPMKRLDGGLVFVEASTWKDADGNLQAIVRDITDRKQAEEALQQKAEALLASNEELELFNLAATGRELRMIELKQEINELCRRLGEPPRHATDPLETDNIPGAGL